MHGAKNGVRLARSRKPSTYRVEIVIEAQYIKITNYFIVKQLSRSGTISE